MRGLINTLAPAIGIMIIFGSGGDVLNLGEVEVNHCETCETDRPYCVVLQYRYCGLYFVFNFVTSKKYFLMCDVCQGGYELESSEIEQNLTSNPIPFMHRFGMLLLIGGFGMLFLFAMVSASLAP